ncbi:MAG: hypothetical protein LBU40_04480, partial [Methanobrevibacter sp.]|nr:hypothetical protein [Methanobrevibacter sp.]
MFNQKINVANHMNMLQNIDTDSQSKILLVDYGKDDLSKLRLKAPFLEFLEQNGSVNDTNESRHKYRTHLLDKRAALAGEYGTIDSDYNVNLNRDSMPLEYGTAVVDTPTVKTSDLFRFTQEGNVLSSQVQDEVVRDLQTNIDYLIFGAGGSYSDNKFDGLKDKAANTINLDSASVTVKDLNDGIQQILDNHGLPNIIVGTGNAIQQVIDSDENQKIYSANEPLVLGQYGSIFQSTAGQTPILVDPNINNLNPGENTGDEIYILDSSSYEIRFLARQFMKKLADTDLADSYKYASFLSSCLKVPEWVTRITNIGNTAGTEFIKVYVQNATNQGGITGAEIELHSNDPDNNIEHATTNGSTYAYVRYVKGNDLTIIVSKSGFTTY